MPPHVFTQDQLRPRFSSPTLRCLIGQRRFETSLMSRTSREARYGRAASGALLKSVGAIQLPAVAHGLDAIYHAGSDVDVAKLAEMLADGTLGAIVSIGEAPGSPVLPVVTDGTARHAALVAGINNGEGKCSVEQWEAAIDAFRVGHGEMGLVVVVHHDDSRSAKAMTLTLLATYSLAHSVIQQRSFDAALGMLRTHNVRGNPTSHHLALADRTLVRRGWYARHANLVAGGGDDEWVCYVGDRFSASSRAFIEENGITHVVNCGVSERLPNHYEKEGVKYATVNSSDANPRTTTPARQWARVMAFLQEAQDGKARVLVHCVAGMNRSVTTAALYLTVSGAFPCVRAAAAHICQCRPIAAPQGRYLDWADDYVRYGPKGRPKHGAGGAESEGSPPPSKQERKAKKKERRKREVEKKGARGGSLEDFAIV